MIIEAGAFLICHCALSAFASASNGIDAPAERGVLWMVFDTAALPHHAVAFGKGQSEGSGVERRPCAAARLKDSSAPANEAIFLSIADLIFRRYGFDSVTHQQVDPSQFRDYLDGRKRAYVIVGGRHQFFPKRELDTIEYSIEDTYRGLYQELRGYLGKPGRHRGSVIAPTGEELTTGIWV